MPQGEDVVVTGLLWVAHMSAAPLTAPRRPPHTAG